MGLESFSASEDVIGDLPLPVKHHQSLITGCGQDEKDRQDGKTILKRESLARDERFSQKTTGEGKNVSPPISSLIGIKHM